MRHLVLANLYPPHHYGGYELVCLEYVEHLEAQGHEVLVLTSTWRVPEVEAPPEDQARVRRELRLYWSDHVILKPGWRETVAWERANQEALHRAIADHEPDVVSVWPMGCLSLQLLATVQTLGLPAVLMVCDDWLAYGPIVDRWTARTRRPRALARLATRLTRLPTGLPRLDGKVATIYVSGSTAATAATTDWAVGRTAIGGCGINTTHFPVRDPDERPWRSRLLHVGRIDDRKGIDTLLRALPLLPHATLDVVGRGDEAHRRTLTTLAEELGVTDRVRWSVSTREELAAVYAAADVVLFTPVWAEPFGLVPIEAMACSTPVIATGTGGSAEFLVDGANALLVPVADPAAVAAAVEHLAADPALRQRLTAGGRTTATELTLAHWFEVLDAWHAAAATRFTGPDPAPRPSMASVLAERLG